MQIIKIYAKERTYTGLTCVVEGPETLCVVDIDKVR